MFKALRKSSIISVLCSVLGFGAAFGLAQQADAQPSPTSPPPPMKVIGQAVFEQPGANSCMYCHGIEGHDGKVAVAANLSQPKTWKSYKGLGGDAAYNKNKVEFLKHLEEAVENLVQKGAISHNSGFKPPWFDWKATGGPINGQMLGLTAAPSTAWLNRQKDKGMTRELAAKSLWLHVQSLDKQGVFK